MRAKTLIVLAAATAVLGGAAIYVNAGKDAAPVDRFANELVFPQLAPRAAAIAAVRIERDGETFALARAGDGWTMPGRDGYPVDGDLARRFLLELGALRVLESRTANPALHAELDLDGAAKDQKATRVAVLDAQGAVLADLLVGRSRMGRQGTAGDGTFVRRNGENQVFLARGRFAPERDAAKWLDRRVANVERERIARIELLAVDGERLSAAKAGPGDNDVQLADVPDDRRIKSAFDVNLLASALEGLDLDDARKAEGLDFDAARERAEYRTFDGLVVRVDFVQERDLRWARLNVSFEAPAEPVDPAAHPNARLRTPEDAAKQAEEIAARVRGWAYRFPDFKIEQMTRRVADLVEAKE
ncbi:MAG: DUF4340 domain-containing protein [Azospirillum sp.]|nr:DUF4340 domain-containing protein [Azospirillum sp.]MCA3267703.1 DUF4340 domain-containing protein [Azospirillum sp.]